MLSNPIRVLGLSLAVSSSLSLAASYDSKKDPANWTKKIGKEFFKPIEKQEVISYTDMLNAGTCSASGSECEYEAGNINGPGVMRIPSFIPTDKRASSDAKYYLYFAGHDGHYIKMAYSNSMGPDADWTIYNTKPYNSSTKSPRGVMDLFTHKNKKIESVYKTGDHRNGHIASPFPMVDKTNKRIVLFYHGEGTDGHKQAVATSQWGLNFNNENADERHSSFNDLGKDDPGFGSRSKRLGQPYFQVFEVADKTFAYATKGVFAKAKSDVSMDGLDNGDRKSNDRKKRGIFRSHEQWEMVSGSSSPFIKTVTEMTKANGIGSKDPRHGSVFVDGDQVYVAYTIIGTNPESVFVSKYDLSGLSTNDKRDPTKWHNKLVGSQLLLTPSDYFETYDNNNYIQPVPSQSGQEDDFVNELRDPTFFLDDSNENGEWDDAESMYLFYAYGGESGIAKVKLEKGANFSDKK